jgi:outer membrane lipoprotein
MEDIMKPLLLLLSILISACSSMPTVLKNAPAVDVNLGEVLGNANRYRGTPVRWGGTIIEVENEADVTEIQVLYYPLDKSGRPRLDKKTQGRFIVQSPNFLDPAIYKKDSEITVTGNIKGEVERSIGKKMLALPLVEIGNIYLWPEEDYRDVYYGPYMGYYPYYYYPYSRFGYYYYPWY